MSKDTCAKCHKNVDPEKDDVFYLTGWCEWCYYKEQATSVSLYYDLAALAAGVTIIALLLYMAGVL